VLARIRGSDSPGAQAIPLDLETHRIIEALKRGEEVEYGFLGVQLTTELPDQPKRPPRIFRVTPGSPAERAGLRANDTIVSVNGKAVRENDDLFLFVGICLAGGTARIEVERAGDVRRTFEVKLAKFYVGGPIIAARRPAARGGLRVDYTSILAQRGAISPWGRAPPPGVVIREVVPNSSADKANLQPDKIITQVNGRAVTTPAEYYAEMAKATARAELTILDSQGRPERVPIDLK